MNGPEFRPISLADVPLEGDRLVRLAYVDEAGVSKPSHEPYLVVSGVIIDADRQLTEVERYLEFLVRHHLPREMRVGFVFHACDLWAGAPPFSDRKVWPLERRLKVLDALVEVIKRFDLPISVGFVERATVPPLLEGRERFKNDVEIHSHISAFLQFAGGVEKFMRERTSNEIALLIAEDRDMVRAYIKDAHAVIRNPDMVVELALRNRYIPFERIRDTVHFAKKNESAHLQLADMCSFFIKGHLMGKAHTGRFYDVLDPHLIVPLEQFPTLGRDVVRQ